MQGKYLWGEYRMSKKPVCLILGAGAGIGGNVGKKFAKEGYHTVLVRRSDEEGLNKLVTDINDAGASAIGRLINAVEEGAIENLIADIENNEGPRYSRYQQSDFQWRLLPLH